MLKFDRIKLVVIAAILLTTTPLTWAAPGEPLDMIPADSLAVVRVNNLMMTLQQIDAFAAGVSPLPLSISMQGPMLLGQAIGNPQLAGLNMNAPVALFVVFDKAKQRPNIFMLVPVEDFKVFAESSAAFGKSPSGGIYEAQISSNAIFYAKEVPGHALIHLAERSGTDAITKMAGSISAGGANSITANFTKATPDQLKLSSPVWIYANIEQISNSFGSGLSQQLAGMQMMMEMSNPEMAKKFANIDPVKILLGLKSVIAMINLKPDALTINEVIFIKPGSEADKLFKPDSPLISDIMQKIKATVPEKADKKTVQMLTDAQSVDYVCAYNLMDAIAPAISMQMKMASMSPGNGGTPPAMEAGADPMIKELCDQVKSRLAYSVKFENGKVIQETVLPKTHLAEVVQAVMPIFLSPRTDEAFSNDTSMGMPEQPFVVEDEPPIKVEPLPVNVKVLSNTQIEPLVGLGKLRFGMGEADMKQFFGQPQSSTAHTHMYLEQGFCVVADTKGTVKTILCGNKSNPNSSLVKNCKLRTAKNIGMGSTESEVITAYGDPSAKRKQTIDGTVTLRYTSIAAEFILKNDKVIHMAFKDRF